MWDMPLNVSSEAHRLVGEIESQQVELGSDGEGNDVHDHEVRIVSRAERFFSR